MSKSQKIKKPFSCDPTGVFLTFWRFDFLTFLLAWVVLSFGAAVAASSPEAEPDDRLPREERRLVVGLIQRGMPELVDEMLSGRPRMHRVHIARAYSRSGADAKEPKARERFFERAAKEYRGVIKLGLDRGWMRGERRRLNVAQWRVEFADMILRRWIAADLDRFEITSGLDFNRRQLEFRLREAALLYAKAGKTLMDMDVGVRTDEERFLLLGIVDQIAAAFDRQQLNIAWAWLYLAMVGEPDAADRPQLLNDALNAFDDASPLGALPERKYNALLGAGIALRELGRLDEAESAFDRILSSTASRSLTARAGYEKARSLMRAELFDTARSELERLALQPTGRLDQTEAGALFYIRLAPLIHAYTHLRESQVTKRSAARRKEMRRKAQGELFELIEQGGPWLQLVQVYLDVIVGAKRNLDELTDDELVITANRLMSQEKYDQAARAWRSLLDRKESGVNRHQARLNLGVCYFQMQKLRAAAEAFLVAARSGPPPAIAEKAVKYAYFCWRQLAAKAESRDDYLKLAEAAELFAEVSSDQDEVAEAGWIAAVAWEEAGEYRQAERAYRRVPDSDANYWPARRNISRCRQRLYEGLPHNSTRIRRQSSARRAVTAWLELADAMAALPEPDTVESTKHQTTQSSTYPSGKDSLVSDEVVRQHWIHDARIAGASLLAGEDLRDYKRCLSLLGEMPASARVLGLRIRCLQGLGDIKEANRVLEVYLAQDTGAELGGVLVGLAADMESEIKRLQRVGRQNEARRMANETLPTVRHLLDWIRSQPERQKQVSIVELSLVRTLMQAGKDQEAEGQLDELMAKHSENGSYVRMAAKLQETIAQTASGPQRGAAMDKAESLWARLLKDASLRDRLPGEYWEARYNWLKHQLRHDGRAAEVLRGIESERAWYPELGGPPWQASLLALADQARAMVEALSP